MKKYLPLLIVILFSSLWSVSTIQDSNNDNYLSNLDEQIVQNIKLIEQFNSIAQQNFETINGIPAFTNMLMGFTMELANIRTKITDAQTSTILKKEEKIKQIIRILDPQMEISKQKIDRLETLNYLRKVDKELNNRIVIIRKNIIEEEKKIVQYDSLSKTYFSFHTHHFLYALMSCYLDSAELLSNDNLNALEQLVNSIQQRLLKESDMLEKKYKSEKE